MGRRLAWTLVVAAALVTAAPVARAETSQPLSPAAKSASDAFVRALVVRRDLAAARRYASPRFADIRKIGTGFVRDGVDTVVGASRVLRGCRSLPSSKPSPRGDCVLYHLRGGLRAKGSERRTDADFKVWVRQETGSWRVWAYSFSALVTVCPGSCR
jgi:hypothetical protein